MTWVGVDRVLQGLINVFQVSSTWLTVNMALGRYFAICRPLHARGYINARGTLLTVLVICVGSLVFNVPRFCHYRAVETPCDWLLDSETDNSTAVLLDQPPGCRCVYYSKVLRPYIIVFSLNHSSQHLVKTVSLWSPYVIGHTIIFSSCFFLSSSFFLPRLISAAGDWMFTILRHVVWP